MRIFAVHFWHSEGWSSRTEALLEAVMKRSRTTKHPWLLACDANMSREDFEKSIWFQKDRMHVITQKECQRADQKKCQMRMGGEKVYDYVISMQ